MTHWKQIKQEAPEEYQKLFDGEHKRKVWTISILSYIFNFKSSLLLISWFADRPYLMGEYNDKSW